MPSVVHVSRVKACMRVTRIHFAVAVSCPASCFFQTRCEGVLNRRTNTPQFAKVACSDGPIPGVDTCLQHAYIPE